MSQATQIYLTNTFARLGQRLLNPDEHLTQLIADEHHYNAWFTPKSVAEAIKGIGTMLNEADLTIWLKEESRVKNQESGTDQSQIETPKSQFKVGLILAGNIPLVGFHDVLCVLASGNYALIKASSNDARLLKYVLNLLVEIAPEFTDKFSFVERLAGFDA